MTTQSRWEALGDVPVVDSEGKELGAFAGAKDGYLKVTAPHAFDFWIPIDTVAETRSDGVRLKVAEDALEKRKNSDKAEDLTETEIEEGTDGLPHSLPVERRYEAEAEYLIRPHQ